MGRKSREKKERREKLEQAREDAKKRQEQGLPDETGLVRGDEQELLQTVLADRHQEEYDQQEKRIWAILGATEEDDLAVNDETIETYFDYLQENLPIPCIVTGIEDMGCFGWEEFYTFGPGSKREHEKLKKKYPSYTDTYELLGFSDEFDEEEGIFVHVKRLKDNKKFTLPLADLEGTGDDPKAAQLINDYVVWFVNYHY